MSPREAPRHVPGIPDSPGTQPRESRAPSSPYHQEARRDEATGDAEAIPILKAQSLSIGWTQRRTPHVLVSNINFKVMPGHLVALVGPNGAGKSSLLKTIAGLLAPCGGSFSILGSRGATISVEARASLLACVFNERIEAGYLTVGEFVAFGRYPYTKAHNRLSPEDRKHIARALDLVGMGGFAWRTFSSLSDGERQKVQLARAVAQDTPLLIFDEPTAFLDAPSRIEIFRLADRLIQEAGKTVLICTHEVDLALRTADALWVIDREHRFMAGSPSVIAHSGAIGRAFDLPTVAFDPVSGSFRARAQN